MSTNQTSEWVLLLSGGSFKDEFQVPLLEFLEKKSNYPHAIMAISGGVPNALAYMLKKAKYLSRIWGQIKPDKLFEIDEIGLLSPIFRLKKPIFESYAIFKIPKFLERIIDAEIDFEAILNAPIQLWIGVVDLCLGRVEWYSNKDLGMTSALFREIVFASIRIPIFFPPQKNIQRGAGLHQFVDAGLVTNLSIGKAVELNYSRILAISAIPQELSPIAPLDTWPEIYDRHNDIVHATEISTQTKWTERVNLHVRWLERLRRHPLIRLGLLTSKSLRRLFEDSPVIEKRLIDLCVISPPPHLAIFQKGYGRKYGNPSPEARQELLQAGRHAIQETLPFLET